jgi:hypothetical protein
MCDRGRPSGRRRVIPDAAQTGIASARKGREGGSARRIQDKTAGPLCLRGRPMPRETTSCESRKREEGQVIQPFGEGRLAMRNLPLDRIPSVNSLGPARGPRAGDYPRVYWLKDQLAGDPSKVRVDGRSN